MNPDPLEVRRPTQVWDVGVQNERTSLAWSRSLLSCLGCLLLLARLAADVAWALGAGIAAGTVALGAAAGWARGHRYRRAAGALDRGDHLPDGTLNLIVTALVMLTGTTAAVLIVVQV